MNPPPPASVSSESFAAARVTPNARHAFGGVWRLTVSRFFTVKHWLILGGLAALLALLAIPLSRDRDYLPWVCGFYLTFLVPVIGFLTAGSAMREEFKGATVDYVLTRPVRRPAFLGFKFLSHLACTQLDFLFALAVVVGVGVYRGAPGVVEAVPLFLLAQAVLLTAFSALGFLAAVLTARYVFVGMVYGGIIEIGVGKIPTQLSRLSMTQQVKSMLGPLARPPGVEALTPDPSALGVTVALLAVAVVAVALAAALFSWQELMGGGSRET